MNRTQAEERYYRAKTAGKPQSECDWTRDNPPGICHVHPERHATGPTRRLCSECVAKAKAAALDRAKVRTRESRCAKCGKMFESLTRTHRSKCPSCFRGWGQAPPPAVKREKPAGKPTSATKPNRPMYPGKPKVEPTCEILNPGIVPRWVEGSGPPTLRCPVSGVLREFCHCGGRFCDGGEAMA